MNFILIVATITLTWSVNLGFGADIVDSGNFFDRINPIRSIVGPQSYDNAKLNVFTLPSRMIQGIGNIAMAPWRGNDFSGRGGKFPTMSNLFSGLPIVGSVLGGSRGSRGSRGTGPANNYGPMAPVEMARAPGSGSASASGSSSASVSGQNAGRPSGSASASSSANVNLPGQRASSMSGYPSLPSNFFASLPMPSAPGQASAASQSSRPSSPTSASSPSPSLPSIPSSSTSSNTPSGSSSTPRLPSVNLGSQSASAIPSTSGPASASSSMDPAIAQALNGLGFNLNDLNLGGSFGANGQSPSSRASAPIGASGQPQAAVSVSSQGSSPFSSLMSGQPAGQASASTSASAGPGSSGSSGLASGFSSLLSGGGSSSMPGIGQASNFLSNLFNYPLTG